MGNYYKFSVRELELDRRILNILQKYKVASNADIARAVQYTPRQVRNRCHVLASGGYIMRVGIRPMFWVLLPDPRKPTYNSDKHGFRYPSVAVCKRKYSTGNIRLSDYYPPPGVMSIDFFAVPKAPLQIVQGAGLTHDDLIEP